MIYLKDNREIELIAQGGEILSRVMVELAGMVRPGVSTGALEEAALRLMRRAGAEPAFKGYRGSGDSKPFPTALCTSINHEVVHAPALPSRVLDAGDLLKIDVGLVHRGMYTDMAATFPVGDVPDEAMRLVRATREALSIAISKVSTRGWISDIGKAVDRFARRNGFSTVKDLVGHGVGKFLHEEPRIPNYFDASMEPVRMEEGMVLALEPMVNAGGDAVDTLDDGWTVVTSDGSLSAHFEATVALTSEGAVILTPLPPL